MDGTVLVADDDRTIRTVLTQALTRAGCKVHATSSLVTLMRWVEEGKGDLVISDVIMPDGNGLETLPKIAERRPGMPVIVISAQNTITTAIRAAEAEAYDYLPKPFDLPDLMQHAARALEIKRRATGQGKAEPISEGVSDLPLVGRTPQMQVLYRLVARIINTELPLLIMGESGTGKSLIARTVHDFSDRRALPFVTVAAEDLADADAPAIILSKARSGALLFDEIGDLDDAAQARLVQMLNAMRENAPRVLSVSQRDLAPMLENGSFRRDLFYRLGGVTVTVPALRERVDDIPLLAEHFLLRADRAGDPPHQLAPDAVDVIRAYSWPGNVRQLENTIKRLVLTAVEGRITRAEVEQALSDQPAVVPTFGGGSEKLSMSVTKHLKRYFDLH
ncbi:MAG: sigma-54 dependent transcriptional regulator, partial [Pseudomonadota bacterium]